MVWVVSVGVVGIIVVRRVMINVRRVTSVRAPMCEVSVAFERKPATL